MDHSFWRNKWANNEIGFHQLQGHDALRRFWPQLTKGARVLVPLCGKPQDLIWLADQGYSVVGVELSRKAIEDFLQENHLTFVVKSDSEGELYYVNEKSIALFCGDFFAFQDDAFDALYDRAALVALPEMVRQGKGKKDRMIPIGERAVAWIDKYLNDVRPELTTAASEQTLFLSNLGTTFTPNRVTAMIRNYIDAARIGKRGSCHLFRHLIATHMLEHGADIRFIQAMLGHAKMDTTQIYTQVSIKKLKAVHTLTHPAKMDRMQAADWYEAQEINGLPDCDAETLLSILEKRSSGK